MSLIIQTASLVLLLSVSAFPDDIQCVSLLFCKSHSPAVHSFVLDFLPFEENSSAFLTSVSCPDSAHLFTSRDSGLLGS